MWRRRIIIGAIVAAIVLPIFIYRERIATEPIGVRVFDDVSSSIADTYYDPTYHGTTWAAIADRYRKDVEGAPDAAARYEALRHMLSQLGDSHTMAYSPQEIGMVEHRADAGALGAALAPIDGRLVVVAVAPHSPSARAHFQRGDVVLAADLSAGSPGALRAYVLKNPITGHVRSVVIRLAPAISVSDPRGAEVDWEIIAPGVGYLRIGSFPEEIDEVLRWAMQEISHEPAIVLDLRSNPGGMLDAVDATAGVFLPKGTLVVTGRRRFNLFGPEQFAASDAVGAHYAGRLIVVVDRSSESGAETLAAALQAHGRARIVGVRTAGKVMGVDLEEPLPDGGLLRVATLDMFSPTGVRLEGRGVLPDVVVHRTAVDVARGVDPQLRAAIEMARGR
jgi:carboxyl-terminal processing protease